MPILEGRCPHLVEKLAQARQPFGASTVKATGSQSSFGQKTCVLEHGEMLAYGGSCHVEAGGDLTRREF
jgi:hypothetical protein